MEERIFTFLSMVGGHDQYFMVLGHSLIVFAIVLFLVKSATNNLQLEPIGLQNVMEWYVSATMQMGKDVMGEENARKYLPLIASLGLFIFVSNMIGIVPGFESPTANINVTLALAVIVFIYYNFEGIRKNGVGKYFKHFLGPVWWLAWLMFPIEIISHFSRIISLSFRLFGSISGDDMFTLVLLMLVPWIVPMTGFFMLFAFGILQTFIFMILTVVYIGGAIQLEEDH
jgi:F-type H+-transporting ATPase subunit a